MGGLPTTTLGRTGLTVTRCGVGGGSKSRLGLAAGHSEAEAVSLIQLAAGQGVNLFDSAHRSGTDLVVGRALVGRPRDSFVLSSKSSISNADEMFPPATIALAIDRALKDFGVDHIDLFSLHGVLPDEYDYAETELLPVLQQARRAGKIGHVGITEAFVRDPAHLMMSKALATPHWDIAMIGYNLLNPSADLGLFAQAQVWNTAVIGMFAFRHKNLSFAELLAGVTADAKGNAADYAQQAQRLRRLLDASPDLSPSDASYGFAAANPAIHATLIGTGSAAHLLANIACFAGRTSEAR